MFRNHACGAWDNVKKYVKEGNLSGKGSEVHKTTIVSDNLGDPYKDTAAPLLNILLKLIAVVSLVFALLIDKLHGRRMNLLSFMK